MNFSNDNVCAVVVSYFPDSGLPERLARISEQAKKVILVDNGTKGRAFSTIDIALRGMTNIELIKNSENLGVATALNQGVKKALEYGFSWVVTFDQDSIPQPNMVVKMLETWEAYPRPEKLMVVGPQTIFSNCSQKSVTIQDDKPWQEVTHVITAGSLISKQAFESVGYYFDNLFIDYIDIEYCLRLRNKGYNIIQVRDAILLHKMGNIEEHSIFRRSVYPTHHDPVRHYYQFRNALLLHRIYKKTQADWCRQNLIILIKFMCLIFLCERRRIINLFQIIKGILHGLSGRAGRRGETNFDYVAAKSAFFVDKFL
jgi:rhamnosyltransferase